MVSTGGTLVPGTPPLVGTDWAYYQGSAQGHIGTLIAGPADWPGHVSFFDPLDPDASLNRFASVQAASDTTGLDKQQDRRVSMSFQNAGDGIANYSVGVLVSTSAYTVAPAIPEPGTWILTGIGLAAAGWMGRRRAARGLA